MRGTVAKRLRKEAAALSRGAESKLVRIDGMVRHRGYRRIYQELKKKHIAQKETRASGRG